MKRTNPITDIDKINTISKYLLNQSVRNYMLFAMGINLGLRISDFTVKTVGYYRHACSIGYVELVPSKTDIRKRKDTTKSKSTNLKSVIIPISNDLKNVMITYMQDMTDDEYMFPSRKGGTPIERQQAHKILSDAFKYVGITESVGCHGMRKTFGYWHYKKNNDVRTLMILFGHASEEVTLRYIGVLQEELTESMAEMNLGLKI